MQCFCLPGTVQVPETHRWKGLSASPRSPTPEGQTAPQSLRAQWVLSTSDAGSRLMETLTNPHREEDYGLEPCRRAGVLPKLMAGTVWTKVKFRASLFTDCRTFCHKAVTAKNGDVFTEAVFTANYHPSFWKTTIWTLCFSLLNQITQSTIKVRSLTLLMSCRRSYLISLNCSLGWLIQIVTLLAIAIRWHQVIINEAWVCLVLKYMRNSSLISPLPLIQCAGLYRIHSTVFK